MASIDLIIIGFTIGLIAYITLYFGKGIQKYAIEGIKEEKSIKKKNTSVWIVGTILTTVFLFVQWLALFFAPVNIIAPLEGVGLITLIIFSYYVLKETITQKEIIGIILIIIGTVLITLFNLNFGDLLITQFNQTILVLFFIIVGVAIVIGIAICALKDYKGAGIVIGVSAGALMACQTAAKRVSTIDNQTIFITYIVIVLIYAISTLAVTQFAFVKAKANRILPCFTSASIILATVIGAFALSELVHVLQIVGIGIMVVGIVFLTAFRQDED